MNRIGEMFVFWIAALILTASGQERAPSAVPETIELARVARAAMVRVNVLHSTGTVADSGVGFHIGGGRIVTASELIEGVTYLSLEWNSGETSDVESILALDRRQDWVLLPTRRTTAPSLKIAREPLEADRRYFVMAFFDRAWQVQTIQLGPRRENAWELSDELPADFVGAPVLNSRGEAVAMVGGSAIIGLRNVLREQHASELLGRGTPTLFARPLTFDHDLAKNVRAVPLVDLIRSGVTLLPLVEDDSHFRTTLTSNAKVKGQTLAIGASQSVFGRDVENIYVCSTWRAKKDRTLITGVAVYTATGEQAMPTLSGDLVLDRRKSRANRVPIPAAKLRPGVYRAELLVDQLPVWRSFFRILE